MCLRPLLQRRSYKCYSNIYDTVLSVCVWNEFQMNNARFSFINCFPNKHIPQSIPRFLDLFHMLFCRCCVICSLFGLLCSWYNLCIQFYGPLP
ncbi:hypothetical protein FKM82_021125 [Ascaphus truei]